MNKPIQYIIWSLIFTVVNLSAIQIASFSLFTTKEGTSIFSLDYLIAFAILLVANFTTIQLFLAIRKSHQKELIIGLIIAALQAIGLYILIYTTMFNFGLILSVISISAALVLLIVELKKR